MFLPWIEQSLDNLAKACHFLDLMQLSGGSQSRKTEEDEEIRGREDLCQASVLSVKSEGKRGRSRKGLERNSFCPVADYPLPTPRSEP